MESIESVLKKLVPIDVMFIHTKEGMQSSKFFVYEGLVKYKNDLLEPRDMLNRFIEDTPMLTVIVAEVCRRHIEEYRGKSYRWETLEKLVP